MPDLIALTGRYPAADNATKSLGQDLTNKLEHGRYDMYISKVLKEPRDKNAGLTAAQAGEPPTGRACRADSRPMPPSRAPCGVRLSAVGPGRR